MNYKNLILWLIDNTAIDNSASLSNAEIKKYVVLLSDLYIDDDNFLNLMIGDILKLIYGDELSVERGGAISI